VDGLKSCARRASVKGTSITGNSIASIAALFMMPAGHR